MVSKKETEFERYERMKKLQKEAEFQKRKEMELNLGKKKKKGRMKISNSRTRKKDWTREYEAGYYDEDDY
ncbi:hypothetical protein [Defluviitalea phaphyphila]|uniref:hypothetical protein n=1 Tax=Defluviitalea phaphyphila TaxID=1473580 RepID=UPI0007307173|nr:hypothetical protein [Defluviitalea phaphyphila]